METTTHRARNYGTSQLFVRPVALCWNRLAFTVKVHALLLQQTTVQRTLIHLVLKEFTVVFEKPLRKDMQFGDRFLAMKP